VFGYLGLEEGYILCPTPEIVDAFRGHYASLQYDNVVFEQVLSACYMPDVDQHTRALLFILCCSKSCWCC
ncbi:unnamed protein product, partial [Urochloa humidicola]